MLALLCGAVLLQRSDLPTFTPDQLKADFKLAHEIFDADDAGMYRYVAKPELDQVWSKAEAKLDHPMTAVDFFRILLPTVAAQKCGHSAVQLPKPMQDDLSAHEPLLPLFVKVMPDGAYVYRDLSGAQATVDGSKIESINGKSIRSILDTMMHDVTMDGDSASGRRYKISGQQFSVYLVSLLDLHAPYQVRLRTLSGVSETVSYDGIVLSELGKRAQEKKATPFLDDFDPAKFSWLGDGKVGYLKIQAFNDSDGHEAVRKVYADTFQALKDRGAQSLIIDVRDNGGGEDELGQLLLSYLETKPFKYYDHLYLNGIYFKSSSVTGQYQKPPDGFLTRLPDGRYEVTGHPNWGIKQPSSPHFGGKVYVLTNGYSFSTTCEFLSHIKSERLATLIGEDTGGTYYGNTSGISTTVTLPNTGVRIRVPSIAYWLTVDHRYPPASPITPDVRLVPSIKDLVAGKDPVLERALEIARNANSRIVNRQSSPI